MVLSMERSSRQGLEQDTRTVEMGFPTLAKPYSLAPENTADRSRLGTLMVQR